MPTNDNNSTPCRMVDAHGEAALLLVESLIHGLCELSVLTSSQAIDIIERAADVQFDRATEADDARTPLWRSHALLVAIAQSIALDVESEPPPVAASEEA